MRASDKCVKLIKHFEGFKSTAYLCPANKWSIGFGTTVYPDGEKVQKNDIITEQYAEECLMSDLKFFEKSVEHYVTADIAQFQFDALVALTYNIGPANFATSTVLKRVNKNPFDPTIEDAWLWFNKGNGEHNGKDDDGDGLVDEPGEKQKIEGLTRRRKSEAFLYFNDELNFFL